MGAFLSLRTGDSHNTFKSLPSSAEPPPSAYWSAAGLESIDNEEGKRYRLLGCVPASVDTF